VLGVNVMGVVHGSQTFGKRFAEQREGHIVNTASVGGFMGSKDMVIYSTSKFAVVGYTEALRAELEPHGVGVSTLCPGPVATALGTADRLRPDEYGSSAATSETVSPFIADGLDPMKVGETVLAGVLANREYIFTDRLFRDAFAQRFERVLAAFDDAP
jgi:short-subunit dehydrogenase